MVLVIEAVEPVVLAGTGDPATGEPLRAVRCCGRAVSCIGGSHTAAGMAVGVSAAVVGLLHV